VHARALLAAPAALALAAMLIQPALAADTLSAKTYRGLQQAQELLDARQPDKAAVVLRNLASTVEGQAYDYAMVMQYLAHSQMLADQPAAALATVTTALSRSDLPPELALELMFYRAKLLLNDQRIDEGLEAIELYFSQSPDPKAEAFYYRGFALFRAGRFREAQAPLEQAVALARRRIAAWDDLLLAAYVQGESWDKAAQALRLRVGRTPQAVQNWKQLAGVYYQQGDHASALATLMLAQRRHDLPPADLDTIIGLHDMLGMPEKGARLLEGWLEDGKLERTPQRLRRLADMWLTARERTQAKQAFARLAPGARTGEIEAILGQLHMEDAQWREAAAALSRALAKGGLKEEPSTRLMLGVCYLKAGDTDRAIAALTEAARAPRLKASAEHWLRSAAAQQASAGH
jgi:tetratricopeptide (TPR) repeat protein